MSEIKNMTDTTSVKMIALDLDGTTLTDHKTVSERNVRALESASDKGVHVVIATGRGFSSVPDDVRNIKGIEYIVCANGADIRLAKDGTSVYRSLLGEKEAADIISYLQGKERGAEIFVDGKAYIQRSEYDDIISGKITYRSRDYILKSRNPVEDIFSFALENISRIENISIFFEDLTQKPIIWDELKVFKNVTVTSSFPHNIEIGGSNTSKATALSNLAAKLGVREHEMMCCGDSLNDMAMLKAAGIAVAMGNAEPELKKIADFVTDTNENDGVAKAVEKFVLK